MTSAERARRVVQQGGGRYALERLGRSVIAPVIGPHIHYAATVISEPREVVRRVPPPTDAVVPVQPERLRGDPDHLRIAVDGVLPGGVGDQAAGIRRSEAVILSDRGAQPA